jgi:hypothetical protein
VQYKVHAPRQFSLVKKDEARMFWTIGSIASEGWNWQVAAGLEGEAA